MPAGGWTHARYVELIGWIAVAIAGSITLTQAFGWTETRAVAVAKSLTPYLGLVLLPVAALALWGRRLTLTITCVAVGFGILVLATPLAFPDDQAEPIDGATGLRVAALNLLYTNNRSGAVAEKLTTLSPDVIVFSEYTTSHQAILQASDLADDYPYRIDRIAPGGVGIAVWSRDASIVEEYPDTYNHSLDVIVEGPDGDIRIVALHVPTPFNSFENWQRDLHTVGRIGRDAATPTLVVGDLNASYWHPDFRDLLDTGFVDAHIANGEGFSTSWPTDMVVPPFVRLDHALTTGGLVSTDVVDFEIPGSDHRGFVVTVAPTH
ncbi:MAG: endonuclease/exonuclease/phosphatase family protein [Acidimicrobiales bacterium]|nr:MAG: endonuclease/exonuclease/phosphatase family protein [Acidimicrobiales bacterium]